MKIRNYSFLVAKLLTLGDCHETPQRKGWEDYLALGLTAAHVPELILMATDKALLWAESDKAEVWAPIHAWRALGQLRAEAAIEPLVGLMQEIEALTDLYDWVDDTVPRALELIGPSAIPALTAFLQDAKQGMYQRITAMSCLERIGNRYRPARAACVAALVQQLERFQQNDPTFNAFVISSLIDMHESDAMPLMEKAFAADCVDEGVVGDWQDVRAEFGIDQSNAQFTRFLM